MWCLGLGRCVFGGSYHSLHVVACVVGMPRGIIVISKHEFFCLYVIPNICLNGGLTMNQRPWRSLSTAAINQEGGWMLLAWRSCNENSRPPKSSTQYRGHGCFCNSEPRPWPGLAGDRTHDPWYNCTLKRLDRTCCIVLGGGWYLRSWVRTPAGPSHGLDY